MKNMTKEAIGKTIDFHILCVKTADNRWSAISHCEMVCWLKQESEPTYEKYRIGCGMSGIYSAKNFDEEALREALQAGATKYMDPSVTDPLAGLE